MIRSLLFLCLCLACFLPSYAQLLTGLQGEFEFDFDEAGKKKPSDPSMTQEMWKLDDKTWQLDAIDLSKIRDPKLRKHVKKFMPVNISLRSKPGKLNATYKAFANTKDGKKLRAIWKRADQKLSPRGDEILRVSYDEILRGRDTSTGVDFEIQLPPLKGKRKLPALVYTIVVANGSLNPQAVTIRSKGNVKVLPNGLGEEGYSIGKTWVGYPMRAGIVDPLWARGKTIFRRGRSVGSV